MRFFGEISMMPAVIHYGDNPFKEICMAHFRKYGGFLLYITGNPWTKMGVGKTFAAMTMGACVDAHFNLSKVTTSVDGFLEQIALIRKNKIPYQVVILDEGQTSVPSTEWYSVSNKAIFYTLSVFRALNCIGIVIAPEPQYIDKRIRGLFTFGSYPDLIEVNTGYKVGVLNFFRLQKPSWSNNVYTHDVEVWDEVIDSKGVIKQFIVDLPPDDLVEDYPQQDEKNKGLIQEEAQLMAQTYKKALKKTSLQDAAQKYYDHPDVIEEFNKKKKVSQLTLMAINENLNRTDALIVAGLISRRKRREEMQDGGLTAAG